MPASDLAKISKYLSYHLRHRPDLLGLTPAPGGWVPVAELLAASTAQGFPISREQLQAVVSNSDKKRFGFDPTGALIRAHQGHSITIDLQLTPQIPPPQLYHGTGRQFIESILQLGLQKMSRHHVHLSSDLATAQKVAMRQGKPAILEINAQAMSQDGYHFYCSENQVWLVDEVPVEYLKLL